MSGVVRKREDRKDGKPVWEVDYRQDGKRHFERFTTQAQAKRRLTEIQSQQYAGTHTPRSGSITVADAAKLWIDACESVPLERATLRNYHGYIDNHIESALGTCKLADLTGPAVAKFRNDLMREHSPVLARKIFRAFKAIIAVAIEQGVVTNNVALTIKIKKESGRGKQRLEFGVNIPSVEELNLLLLNAHGRWYPFLLTAARAGLRMGELRGLRWPDVDLKAGIISVRQRADRWGTDGAPKSESGKRDVALTPDVINALREWKLQSKPNPRDLVFPTIKGTVMLHSNVCNLWFYPLQRKLGMITGTGRHKYRFHTLRHFYASWLMAEGFPLKQVQEWMGHSQASTTLNIYGHLMPKANVTAKLAAAVANIS